MTNVESQMTKEARNLKSTLPPPRSRVTVNCQLHTGGLAPFRFHLDRESSIDSPSREPSGRNRLGESNDEDGRGGKESRPRKTFDYEYEHRYR